MNDTRYWNHSNSGTNITPKSNGNRQRELVKIDKGRFGFMKNNPRAKIILGRVGIIVGVVFLIVGLISYIYLIRPGLVIKSKISVLQADINKIQESIKNRDLVSLEKNLKSTENDLKELKRARDENFGWAKNFNLTKSYYQDSDHFINAGNFSIEAVRETVELMKPFADAAGLKVSEEQEVQTVGLADAFASWIAVMPQIAYDMDKVLVKLEDVGKELSQVDASKYPEKIRGTPVRSTIENTQKLLTKLSDYAPDIKNALTIIPGLLGVSTGEQRYMIIMQTDKELRPTGRFWTNYATFKVNNALLSSDFSSKDMYSVDLTLDAIDAYYTFGAPPFPYGKYLKVERWYARDANTSPDLPTSVDHFMKSYNLAMRIDPIEIKPVKGIVTIDTQVIKELLEVTGPATVNGITYTSDNVVLELETIASLALKEQQGRKRVLGDLMERMLVNVFESEKGLWSQLIERGIDLAARKHITGYSFDPEAQALLEKYNFAGRIIEPVEGDYSYLVSTNLGGDKTNWFVSKEVDHTLSKENGKWVRTVKVKYAYPEPSVEYGAFVKRFKDWLRVYAPLGSELISVEGSEDGSGTEIERNKTYFWGYVELGPGETKEMTFKYVLPNEVINGNLYSLYLQKQAGVREETHRVTLNGKTETVMLKMDKRLKLPL